MFDLVVYSLTRLGARNLKNVMWSSFFDFTHYLPLSDLTIESISKYFILVTN